MVNNTINFDTEGQKSGEKDSKVTHILQRRETLQVDFGLRRFQERPSLLVPKGSSLLGSKPLSPIPPSKRGSFRANSIRGSKQDPKVVIHALNELRRSTIRNNSQKRSTMRNDSKRASVVSFHTDNSPLTSIEDEEQDMDQINEEDEKELIKEEDEKPKVDSETFNSVSNGHLLQSPMLPDLEPKLGSKMKSSPIEVAQAKVPDLKTRKKSIKPPEIPKSLSPMPLIDPSKEIKISNLKRSKEFDRSRDSEVFKFKVGHDLRVI